MVERICPTCQHGNSLENHYCGKCGTALERQLPVRAGESRLALAGQALPVTWQQVGKTVALGVATLAAEAGLAWLRRRMEQGSAASPAPLARAVTPTTSTPTTNAPTAPRDSSIVTIVSRRVIEIWESPNGHRHVVDQHFWRRSED